MNKSGQTLLIIIFAITLGLVALVGVSTRIVNSTRRVFIDNAYYKAQAVAEAGAEKFLLKTNAELDDLKTGGCTTNLYTATGFVTTIPANCTIDTPAGFTEARAVMAVETYPSGNIYEVSSPANSTIPINLVGATGNVEVCWQGADPSGPAFSEILYFYFGDGMTQKKYACSPFKIWCSKPPTYHTSDGESSSVDGDYSCFNVSMTGVPQLLTLMSLVNGSVYKITFTSPPTQGQGYKIISVGEVKSGSGVGSLANSTATRKKVVVEKSRMPNLGPLFNFAVASESGKIESIASTPTCLAQGDSCFEDNACCSVKCGVDADSDTYMTSATVGTCQAGNRTRTDCDDTNASIHPGTAGAYGCNTTGACSGATRTCQADGTYTTCSKLPTSEIRCNSIDEDCNGSDARNDYSCCSVADPVCRILCCSATCCN